MTPPQTLSEREPSLVQGVLVAAVVGVVVAVIGALRAFGIAVTDDQSDAIVGLIVAISVLAPIVAGILIRRKVTPVK